MSDFTTITSQEQLDTVIADRLKRNEEKWAKKYEGYLSPDDVTKKCGDYEKQIADLTNALDGANKKAASYDKEIAEKNFSLTPGAYVGVAEVEDDGVDFHQRMNEIHSELKQLNNEANVLMSEIIKDWENLK